ncbi:hypothetical protein EVAR_96274_1 [Eumeta japonica]|uniref:Uncharacterized protein n=1 Tax=Eumeta variegata TaxID=151549 RepID=A0A4C1WL35_EUMVA|nr:hypothetical protein EVAR_96274_1 [Eumeta japonica]
MLSRRKMYVSVLRGAAGPAARTGSARWAHDALIISETRWQRLKTTKKSNLKKFWQYFLDGTLRYLKGSEVPDLGPRSSAPLSRSWLSILLPDPPLTSITLFVTVLICVKPNLAACRPVTTAHLRARILVAALPTDLLVFTSSEPREKISHKPIFNLEKKIMRGTYKFRSGSSGLGVDEKMIVNESSNRPLPSPFHQRDAPPLNILLPQEAGNQMRNPRVLRVFMGGGDHLISDGASARFPLDKVI